MINNNYYRRKVQNTDLIPLLTLFSAIFFANPILGILSLLFFIQYKNVQNDKLYFGLYAFIALYFGLLNSTKVPISDLLVYKNYFDSASSTSFNKYISEFKFELLFYAVTYFLNKAFFGNFQIYIIFITFIQYYLIFISIHKFWKNSGYHIVLFAVFIYALSCTAFGYSVHLLRQMLGSSIFIYFFVEKIVNNRNRWFLIVIASLIHTSMVVLFLITFIPGLKEKINLKQFFRLLIIFIFILLIGSVLLKFLGDITSGYDVLNYGIERAQNLTDMEYSWYNGEQIYSIRKLYLLFALIPALFPYFLKNCERRNIFIANYLFIYILVLEGFVYNNLLYMQLRMSVYVLMLTPLALPAIFIFFQQKRIKLVTYSMILILFWYGYNFYNSLVNPNFKMTVTIIEILFNPILFFFN